MYRKDLTDILKVLDVRESGKIFDADGNELSQYDNGYGYLSVRVNKKYYRVHRLVATKFIPNPDNKEDVNHLDGNKSNNCVQNLEWATRKENVAHAHKTGLITERALNARKKNGKIAGQKFGYLVGKSNCIKIDCYVDNRFFKTFESASEASKETGATVNRVLNMCRGKMYQTTKANKHLKKYTFKFSEER